MLNADRFKEEINKHNNEFGLTDNSIVDCRALDCRNCRFSRLNNSDDEIIMCSTRKVKWLLSEYKEPVKLTRLEYEILKYILNHTEYKYIARDRRGAIFIYENKPEKHVDTWKVLVNGGGYTKLTILDELFKFIDWLDLKPTSIQEVLNNCEVVNGES